jgi:hypothetical protein
MVLVALIWGRINVLYLMVAPPAPRDVPTETANKIPLIAHKPLRLTLSNALMDPGFLLLEPLAQA